MSWLYTDTVQESETFAEPEQSTATNEQETHSEFANSEQPCDCLLSDDEIKAIKRLLGSPSEPEYGYDYAKFSKLKLAVIVPEGVMRGSGWKEFVNGVKKYLEPRCPSCK
jgi:hypothetical protein